MLWKLTGNDVDNIGRGDASEDSEHVAYAWKNNRDSADCCLEASGTEDVKRGWEVLSACHHEVERVSEGNVVKHDVWSHCWKH